MCVVSIHVQYQLYPRDMFMYTEGDALRPVRCGVRMFAVRTPNMPKVCVYIHTALHSAWPGFGVQAERRDEKAGPL